MKDFDKSLKTLEDIASKIEGDVTLSESISLFNRGVQISKECLKMLGESKGKIELLVDEVNKITMPLDAEG